jgi:hypothetical protein
MPILIACCRREFELRGGYVSMANLQEVSDYALSDDLTNFKNILDWHVIIWLGQR